MSASIHSTKEHQTQILITVDHGRSMLGFEEDLQQSLNEDGQLACTRQLEYLDTDGSPITVGSTQMISKRHKEPKRYETPWGVVEVARHVY